MLELISICEVPVIAANRFAGAAVLRQDVPRRLKDSDGLLNGLLIRKVKMVEVNGVAHGEREIYADLAFLVDLGRILGKGIEVVLDRFVVISPVILRIAQIVRGNIVLAEGKIGQYILGNDRVGALVVVEEESRVYDIPYDDEDTEHGDCGADREKQGAERREDLFNDL